MKVALEPYRWVILLSLCTLTFLFGLDRQAVTDSDEAFYAEAGREMVAGGDWVTPHYNFEARLQKPILYYWLVAGTYEIAGVGGGAARIWSALSGLGLAVLAGAIARRWYGPGPGLLAGAIAATSFGVTLLARMALPDGPLAFFVTLSIWTAFEHAKTQRSKGRKEETATRASRSWLWISAASLALAVLTKGPVAIALLVLVIGAAGLWARWRGEDARPASSIRAADVAIAALILAAITVPWFVAVTRAQGTGYLHQFFVGENLDRFATTQNNDVRPFWYYLPIVAGGLLPWTPFAVVWLEPLVRLFKTKRGPAGADRRLLVWAVAPVLFFSISIGKQPRYVLPSLVPMAVLLAHAIWERIDRRRADGMPRDRLLAAAGVLSGVLLAALGVLVWRVGPILAAANPEWTAAGPIVMIASGAIVTSIAMTAGPKRLLAAVTIAAAACGLALQLSVLGTSRPEPVELVAARIGLEGPQPVVCACGAFARNLNFYTHMPTTVGDPMSVIERFLESPDRVLAVMDSEPLAAYESKTGRRLPRLLEVPYLNVAALRLKSLFEPDPARYVQRVILVANR